jgi:sugar phosphate isomerase/epimerase
MKQRLVFAAALAAVLSLPGVAEQAASTTNHPHAAMNADGFHAPIGLQLYSLRHMFPEKAGPGGEAEHIQKIEKGLKEAHALGFTQIELAGTYGLPAAKFKSLLDAAGLQPVSEHVSMERLEKELEAVATEAKVLGVHFVGVAWVPHEGLFDYRKAAETAAKFNKIGEALSKHGLHFFDHAHGYEFDPKGKSPEGLKAMDVLIRDTKPEFVTFQMDTFWIKYPGENPVIWLGKYPGRWQLMHIKDMKIGLETGHHTGGTDVSNDVAAGTGQLNWPEILAVAQKEGVRAYFLEDESVQAVPQLVQSVHYLKNLKLRHIASVKTGTPEPEPRKDK